MRPTKIILLLVCSVVLIYCGALAAGKLGLYQPTVTIIVSNLSNQDLKSISISHKSLGITGVLQTPPIAAGKSIKLQIFVPSDGSYTCTATLANGNILKNGSYIEPGYRENIVVNDTNITTKTNLWGNYVNFTGSFF